MKIQRRWMKRLRSAAKQCNYQECDRWVKEQFIYSMNDDNMHIKINGEFTAIWNASKIISKQVLMWAKQEEVQRAHTIETNEPEKQLSQTSPCRYCGPSHPPQRCPAYGNRCSECAKMNYISAVCRCSRQAVHKLEEFKDSQIDTVNTDLIHSNAKGLGIITIFKTSSFLNSINISNKIDTGSNSNMLPFHIY